MKKKRIQMNEKLKYIFENVNNWLNFAEAKNAAIIALDASLIIGIITADNLDISNLIVFLIVIALGISLWFSLNAFIPFTGNLFEKKIEYWNKKNNTTKNIYLYSYIAKYKNGTQGCNDYLRDVAADCGINGYTHNTDDMYLAEEIIYNSKITFRKYKLFGCAIKALLAAVIIFAVVLIINLFYSNWDCITAFINDICKLT